ncbi:FtsK/SpoIIIE domain-containing protein, partial [Actinocatenispora rupis]
MVRCKLSVNDGNGGVVIPSIQQIEALPASDRLLVDVPVGMTVEAIRQRAGELANAARARSCRVTEVADTPGMAWVELQHKDILRSTVAALPIPRSADGVGMVPVDLGQVPVGIREDGSGWAIPVKGRHILIAGRSRSGKGSVLWSLLRYLAPAIRAGVVKVTGLDPKGGMELSMGRPLFTRYEADNPAAMADLLEAEADHMDAVAKELAGNVRKFSPSMTHPLHLVVVDELANLTAYASMEVRRRVELALGRLLTKGAAVGWVVIGCTQEPNKDIIPMRGLFTYRIALGLDTPSQVDMVLGEGMRDKG